MPALPASAITVPDPVKVAIVEGTAAIVAAMMAHGRDVPSNGSSPLQRFSVTVMIEEVSKALKAAAGF